MSWGGQPPGPYGPPPSQGYPPHQHGWGQPPPMQQAWQPGLWRCPFCSSTMPPLREDKISSGGWVLFVVLLLLCFIFCWIPLVTMREDYQRCRHCQTKIG